MRGKQIIHKTLFNEIHYLQVTLLRLLVMKILLISVTTPFHARGGFENVIWWLAKNLAARGHEVHLVTERLSWQKKMDQRPEIDGIHLHYVGMYYYRRQWYPILFYLESSWVIRALVRKYHFDIIHSNQAAIYGYILCTRAKDRPPIVLTAHGTQQTELEANLTRSIKSLVGILRFAPLYPIERKVFRSADKILPINKWVETKILSIERVPQNRIQIVYNGIDDTFFQPGYEDLNVKHLAHRILYLGAVVEAKGVLVLAKAFQGILNQCPDAHLDIAGDGILIQDLKRYFRDTGNHSKVTIHGRVSNEKARELYQKATVFCLPSLRKEGLPLTILESWACGTPVIASRIGGIPAIIAHDKNGLLISPGNMMELSNAILRLFTDRDLYTRLREQNLRDIPKKYSEKAQVSSIERVYESLNIKKNS